VVRDHELGLPRARARGLRVARREERAPPAGAAVAADRELGPEHVGRFERRLGAIARRGRVDPRQQRVERARVAALAEQHRPECLQLLAAEVVLPALQHRDAHLAPDRAGRGRHVLGEQLLLQGLRRRRDDHPPPGLERRDQVREALAGPRPCLRDEVLAARERALDRVRERSLLRPGLEAGQGAGESAAGAEGRVHPVASD
jgi:hypothetical protein